MSEPQVTERDDDSRTQGENSSQPPANNQPPQNSGTSNSSAHAPSVDFGPLMTAIQGLPESIARSVKEAVGTPAKPESKPTENKPAESTESKPAESKPANDSAKSGEPSGGHLSAQQRFVRWWGGS